MDATRTSNGTTKAAKFRPIQVGCPKCGDVEAGLAFGLGDGQLFCRGCDEEVTRADLERVIAEAQRLIRFLDMAATV
jgi:hypothetical protein